MSTLLITAHFDRIQTIHRHVPNVYYISTSTNVSANSDQTQSLHTENGNRRINICSNLDISQH